MNTHVRDNLNLLKTQMDDDGALKTLLKGFAFSSGEGNDAGGADTQLTSYNVTIGADFMDQPGDALIVEGTLVSDATSEAKTCKLQVASGTKVTIYSATSASHIIPFRIVIRRRTSTTGSMTGITWVGAAATGAPTNYLVNSSLGSVDWTASQTLSIHASGSTADSIKLSDYHVQNARGVTGTTV
jgi:hypothetical protein